jgi:hypothetical protein
VSSPLPNTKFYGAVSAQLGTKQNWVDSSDLAVLYRGPYSTAFYRTLRTIVHKEFRMRRAIHALRRGDLRPTHLARVLYHTATLPLARARLELLARLPHRGVAPLAPFMAPGAAALPSPQPEPRAGDAGATRGINASDRRTRGTRALAAGRSEPSPTGVRDPSGRVGSP